VDQAAAAEKVIRAVTQLFFSTEIQQRFHGVASALDVSPHMLKCLVDLAPGEPRPMRALADEWQCDASFVTVTIDGLESRDLVERRVAEHDRRVKVVELTESGAEARDDALATIYSPLAGFAALDPDELVTLAELLGRVGDAQAVHDEDALGDPDLRSFARRLQAQRRREVRGRAGDGDPLGLRAQLEAQRTEMLDEVRSLRSELERVRAEVQGHSLGALEGARRAKDEVKATKGRVKAQAKAAKSETKAALRRAAGADPRPSGQPDAGPR
jgi:DNA-binding MarR family transcriptional regulator